MEPHGVGPKTANLRGPLILEPRRAVLIDDSFRLTETAAREHLKLEATYPKRFLIQWQDGGSSGISPVASRCHYHCTRVTL
jgi:hypothetical protein